MKSCHLVQTTTKIRHGTIFRAEFNPVAGFSILFTNGIVFSSKIHEVHKSSTNTFCIVL